MVSGLTPPDKKRDFQDLSERVDDLRDSVRFKGAGTNIVDATGFAFGAKSPETPAISGLFSLTPSIHKIGVSISWTGATGTIDGGDTVDTDASAWQGKFSKFTQGAEIEGSAFIENLNTTAFTDVAQTLNVGATWTGAVYTLGSLKDNAILLTSTSVLLDDTSGDPILKWIVGTNIGDGAIVLLKPVNGKFITLTTDGNIDIDSDITIGDSSFAMLQFHKNNTNKDSVGTWSVIGAGGGGTGGGGSGGGTWKLPCRIAADGAVINLYGFEIFTNSALWGLSSDLAEGDRVLLKDEFSGANNGIWEVGGVGGDVTRRVLFRPDDFNDNTKVVSEVFTAIEDGTHGEELWHLITINPIFLGTTAQVWSQFGTSGGNTIPAGTLENDHLEWNNTLGEWEAKQTLEFKFSGPWATNGYIRMPNNEISNSWRTSLNDGNVDLKLTDEDKMQFRQKADGTGSSNMVFELMAMGATSPIDFRNFRNARFTIQQNPYEGSTKTYTGISFDGELTLNRRGTDAPTFTDVPILTWDDIGDQKHYYNWMYEVGGVEFFNFTGGEGRAIFRLPPFGGSFTDNGIAYDVQSTSHGHFFRVGAGSGLSRPNKWMIKNTTNETTQPIVFLNNDVDITNSFLLDNAHRIYRHERGISIQNGYSSISGPNALGSVRFLSWDKDIHVEFAMEDESVNLNYTTNGLKIRTNNNDVNAVQILPVGNIWSSSNEIIWASSNHSSLNGLSIHVGFGGSREKMRINDGQTWSYQTLNMQTNDVINTANIKTSTNDFYDIGEDNKRYRNIFAGTSVKTPRVGESLNYTLYTPESASFPQLRNIVKDNGSFTVEIGTGTTELQINQTSSQFGGHIIVNNPSTKSNYLQLFQIQGSQPNASGNSGKLWAEEVDFNGQDEVHPFWFGEGMDDPVDLLDPFGIGGIDNKIDTYTVKSWTDQLTDPTVGVINEIDDVFLLVGDKILLTNTPDPVDQGIYEVTGYILGVFIAKLKRVNGFSDGDLVKVGTEIKVQFGKLGEGAKFRVNKKGALSTEPYVLIGTDDFWFKTVWRKSYIYINGTSPAGWNGEPYPPRSGVTEADYGRSNYIRGFAVDNGGWAYCAGVGDNLGDVINNDAFDDIATFTYTITQSDLDRLIFNPPNGFTIEHLTFYCIYAGSGSANGGAVLITQNGQPMFNDPAQTGLLNLSGNYFSGSFISNNSTYEQVGFPDKMNNPALKAGDEIKVYFRKGVAQPDYTVDDVAIWIVPQKLYPDGNIAFVGGSRWIASVPAGSWARTFITDAEVFAVATPVVEFDKYLPESSYTVRYGTLNGLDVISGVPMYINTFVIFDADNLDRVFGLPVNFDGMCVYEVGY